IEDLSNNTDISQFALKVKLIASKLKNDSFSTWVRNELEGYDKNESLPEYRIIDTEVVANLIIQQGFRTANFTNHVMPLVALRDIDTIKRLSTIKIKDSVLSLEKATKIKEDQEVGYSLTEWERVQISKIYENSNILSAYKRLPQNVFADIIYLFKSKLLEVFIELNDDIFNDELDFDIMTKKQDIEKVVNQTINTQMYFGDKSTTTFTDSPVTIGNNNTINMSSDIKSQIEQLLSKIETIKIDVESDREDIASEIVKIRSELNNAVQQPKILRSAFNAIKGITVGIAANQITPLVNEALKLL
ncbi:MAG: hypothetical protein LUF83_13990, partial [Alistipes sp.]|nr:hypothetical protein [Alistipes sp.]